MKVLSHNWIPFDNQDKIKISTENPKDDDIIIYTDDFVKNVKKNFKKSFKYANFKFNEDEILNIINIQYKN